MCLAQGPQRSDAGEARPRGPSVSSQALYHWATALPAGLYMSVILNIHFLIYQSKHILWPGTQKNHLHENPKQMFKLTNKKLFSILF